jgi:hypothetical protein
MEKTFDIYEWNKKRYLNEDKGKDEAQKLIETLRATVLKKLNENELEELHKNLTLAFDASLKY